MIPPFARRVALALAVTLLAVNPAPAFGQFWRSSPADVVYHRNLRQSERNQIYTAVFDTVDSLVRRVWGTPDEWARMGGDSTTHEALTLAIDPRIWDGSLLTNPAVIGQHDLAWVADLQTRALIVGPCDVTDRDEPCKQGKATILIVLSSIAPDGRNRAAVRLAMVRSGTKEEHGFFSEWTFRLSCDNHRWYVKALEMGPIS